MSENNLSEQSGTSKKQIVIDLNSEYKIKVEEAKDFDQSIFKDIYVSAKQNVLDIIDHANSDETYDSYNNIIAFTGERGKGKSSTMISFMKGLGEISNGKDTTSFFDEFYDNSVPRRAKYNFVTLQVIDPSLFRGKESLFEIVLAKMFSKFKQSLDSSNSSNHSSAITDEDRRELVKHFQSVFENLKYTTGNLKDELYRQEALDALIKLSTSGNLRESFQKLIKCYLRVLGKREYDAKNMLVITIDDFDLKVDGVYDMLEDVRQFLITQNVIILIACKMEQIREAIYESIKSQFKHPQKPDGYEKKPISINYLDKTQKYIDKLFPNQRINALIDFNSLLEENHVVVIHDGKCIITGLSKEHILHSESTISEYKIHRDIESLIRYVTYKKLHILIPKKRFRKNFVIPNTFRELTDYLSFIKESDELKSAQLFEKYILNRFNQKFDVIDRIKSSNKDVLLLEIIRSVNDLIPEYAVNEKMYDINRYQFIRNATNPENISINDISIQLDLLNDYLKNNFIDIDIDNDIDEHFVDTFEIYISLVLKTRNIQFKIPEFYNGVLNIFRSNRNWYLYKHKLAYTRQGLISRLLIHFQGNYSNMGYKAYRELQSNPFLQSFSNTSKFEYGVLTPLSLVGNLINFNLLQSSVFNASNNEKLSPSYQSIQTLADEFALTDHNTLFQDINFNRGLLRYIKENIDDYKYRLPGDEIGKFTYFSIDNFDKLVNEYNEILKIGMSEFNLISSFLKIVTRNEINTQLRQLNLYNEDPIKAFNTQINNSINKLIKDEKVTPTKLNNISKILSNYFDDDSNEVLNDIIYEINLFSSHNISSQSFFNGTTPDSIEKLQNLGKKIKTIFKNGQPEEQY